MQVAITQPQFTSAYLKLTKLKSSYLKLSYPVTLRHSSYLNLFQHSITSAHCSDQKKPQATSTFHKLFQVTLGD